MGPPDRTVACRQEACRQGTRQLQRRRRGRGGSWCHRPPAKRSECQRASRWRHVSAPQSRMLGVRVRGGAAGKQGSVVAAAGAGGGGRGENAEATVRRHAKQGTGTASRPSTGTPRGIRATAVHRRATHHAEPAGGRGGGPHQACVRSMEATARPPSSGVRETLRGWRQRPPGRKGGRGARGDSGRVATPLPA